jgi:zinc/manganese transport system substrate-binding protein
VPSSRPNAPRPPRAGGRAPALLLVAVLAVAAACASSGPGALPEGPGPASAPPVPGGPCPVDPVPVTVSVDQWRDLVQHLGGRCVSVTTVVAGSAADPHEYEPSPADVAALGGARLVVVNGLGYDAWASAAVAARSPGPALVTAAAAAGARPGDNPHLWYSPDAVARTSDAVTAQLRVLLPAAGAHLDERAAGWRQERAPIDNLVASIRSRHGGRTYAATEPVFDPMAAAVGLRDVTPPGYAAAAGNGSDPSPGDLAAFRSALRDHAVDVLVVNTQTEGSTAGQLRSAADAAGVPVVEVTETVAPGQPSFVAWQAGQLEALDRALGGSAP